MRCEGFSTTIGEKRYGKTVLSESFFEAMKQRYKEYPKTLSDTTGVQGDNVAVKAEE